MAAKKVRAKKASRWLAFSWLAVGVAALSGIAAGPLSAGEEAPPAGRVDELMRRIDLSTQERQALARNSFELAKRYFEELDYASAERALVEAIRNDPTLTEASRLLDDVRFLQGERVGDRALAVNLFDLERVRIEQSRVEIERLYAEGLRLQGEAKYAMAIDRFERVVEAIRYSAFPLDLEKTLRQARQKVDECERLALEAAKIERAGKERMAADVIAREEAETARHVENRIRALKQSAQDAFDAEKYPLAEMQAQQILDIRPGDVWAGRMKRKAQEMRHLETQVRTMRESMENWDLLMLDLQEASIPYQKVFLFPSRREWDRITAKQVSLEDRVAAAETSEDREIKTKLRMVIPEISFDEQPFSQVLDVLRQLSGINYVLTKDAKDAVDAGLTVKLEPVRNLTLEQVLNLIMERLGGDGGFGYRIKNGAILIGPKESLRDVFYLEFYNVTDIAGDHPSFTAPPISIKTTAEDQGGMGGGVAVLAGMEEEPAGSGVGIEQLQALIDKILQAGDEEQGTAKYQGGKFVVRTTLENHRKIAALLESLRRLTGVMVTVSSRFLDIQDNFLEAIGVNMGSPVETRLDSSIPDVNGAGTAIAPGYEFIDAQGVSDFRAATIGEFSQILGTEIAPFNISSLGGMAVQYNVLEVYQLEAILTAVSKEQEVKSLDEPRVTSFDGQNAYTMVVDQIAYVKDVEVNQTGVSPVINPVIGSFRVGSILEIRPTVTYDRKYVILEVKPTTAEHVDSKFSQLTLAGGNTIVQVELPVIMMSQIKTTITIPDGGSVLVGGLRRVFERESSIGVPVLRNIPILNILFGRKGASTLRNNLFVLLNAQITIVREEEREMFGTVAGE
ncbi:MAG: hypothetical protein JXP34_21790 [Planctomycetes bacterium]|nr:hypothetical protein [Planctomycetota bacterium]